MTNSNVGYRRRAGVAVAGLGLVLAGVTGFRSGPAEPASAKATVVQAEITVDLSDRRLRMMIGDEEVASYPVAIGKDGHTTPTGTFRVRRMIWNPSWVPPDEPWARGRKPTPPGDPNNPMGRVKIFFAEPDYYIHGTSDEASIGRAASHGCLRMSNEDVIELAKLVMEHGGETRPPNWFRRVLNRVTDTQEVRLATPVPMRVRA